MLIKMQIYGINRIARVVPLRKATRDKLHGRLAAMPGCWNGRQASLKNWWALGP